MEISKQILNSDHKTIEKEIENTIKIRTNKKNTCHKNIAKRDLRKIKSGISKKSVLISKKLFEEANVRKKQFRFLGHIMRKERL